MGRKKVAADCLSFLLERGDVEIAGVLTDSHLRGSVTASLAREKKLKLYDFQTALAAMRAGVLTFELGLSVLYWRKLKDEFLSLPDYGVINFHPAPLPEYKGVGGYNLAVLDGLDRWAASAHFVDADIDTGPIIKVLDFPIDPKTVTAQSLERQSQSVLYNLFVELMDRALDSPKSLPRQINAGGRHLSRRELEALKEVDFTTDDVERKIRAFWFPPYDGAYITHKGVKYTLVNRQILQSMADPAASSLFSPASTMKK